MTTVLRVPMDYEIRPHGDQAMNRGRAHVDCPVRVDPTIASRGFLDATGPRIVLREWNEQVLLHELLHLILGCPNATESDPHGHRTITRLEVALWETGWRLAADRSVPY